MSEKFENIEQLGQIIQSLDRAELRPVQVGSSDTDSWVGIWNTSRNILESVVHRKNSTLFEHKDAFAAFIDAVQQKNLKVTGEVKNHGGRVIIDAKFPEYALDDPNDGQIVAGAYLQNVYSNHSGPSFKGYAGAFRMVCSNGMVIGKVVAEVFKKHEKLADLGKAMLEFVGNVIDNVPRKLKSIVDEANSQDLEMDDARNIILGYQPSKKKAKKIIELIEQERNLTKYGVYNAFTAYATHHAANEVDRMRVQRSAEYILLTAPDDLKRGDWEEKRL